MNKLIDKAIKFGTDKHEGQLDDAGQSYFAAHLLNVFNILSNVTIDENLLCAGLLHDTIEDAGVTYEELVKEFNKDIADLVMEVTHIELFDKKGNKLGTSFPRLKTKRGIMLKFADRLSNLSRIDCWAKTRQDHYLRKSRFWYANLEEKKMKDNVTQYLKDKKRFLVKYNDLNDKAKRSTCCICFYNKIKQAFTWNDVMIEILSNTLMARTMLKKLKKK